MRKIIFFLIVSLCIATQLYAAQSTIKIAEGSACMGDDKSRKQTEIAAMADARRNAIESVQTYITSATEVKDFELQKDLVSAYVAVRSSLFDSTDILKFDQIEKDLIDQEITGMNPKASCGVLYPLLCGIVQLTNSATLHFRNWSFNNNVRVLDMRVNA